MRSRCLLFAAYVSSSLSVAVAQSRPGPAYFLRQSANEARPGLVLLPGGPVPTLPTATPIPTVRAAAAYAPMPAPARQSSQPVPTQEPAPRLDPTGSRAYPPYDPYQNLPESYRKHTLPAVWAEPFPLQLLRRGLGQ